VSVVVSGEVVFTRKYHLANVAGELPDLRRGEYEYGRAEETGVITCLECLATFGITIARVKVKNCHKERGCGKGIVEAERKKGMDGYSLYNVDKSRVVVDWRDLEFTM
jgi:hypothetical protein